MLTGKHRRNLRALGHSLQPIVHVGKGGIDDGLVSAVDRALTDHELVKVKLAKLAGGDVELDRHEAADTLAERTKSEVAQVLGYTLLLYRADPIDPSIDVVTGKRRVKVPVPTPEPRKPPAKSKARPRSSRRAR